jgi:hypothetical protein
MTSGEKFTYGMEGQASTVFVAEHDSLSITQLFGLACGSIGEDGVPFSSRGLITLDTSIGRFDGDDFQVVDKRFNEHGMSILWSVAGGLLKVESNWLFCNNTGIWSRVDTLKNESTTDVTVFGCLSRFAFADIRCEIYSQSSCWNHENQGIWQELNHGTVTLSCEGGRTT